MSGGGGGEKTEKPTAQRLKKARNEGQVPRTAELSAWVGVLVATMVLPHLVTGLGDLVDQLLHGIQKVIVDPRPERGIELLRSAATGALWLLAPFFGVMIAVALVSHAAQGGIRVYPAKFKPKFSTLNPANGLKHLVSAHSAWTLAKTLLKFVVFGWIGYGQVSGFAQSMTTSGHWQLGASTAAAVDAVVHIMRVVAAVGVGLAIADFAMERRRIGKQLKMSHDEVRREHKQTDGDPMLKGMIRGKQREMSRNRMMADLGSADVVIVNPTHVAVALAYEPGKGAPRVVARGAGAAAARIREEAKELRLPLVQDVPLARTIFRSCRLGDEIPTELFEAVAGVFVFVAGLRMRGLLSGVHRNPAAGRDRPGVAA